MKHVWNDEGTQHWLEDSKGRKGKAVGYQNPAVFPIPGGKLVAVTDYFTGTEEFPSADMIYHVTVWKGEKE